MNKAIFPGSFDPFHSGHKYVVKRALKLFDHIYIVVSWNENKIRKNSFEKSQKQIEKIFKDNKNISVLINKDKLTVDILKDLNCTNIIRGFRNKDDIEYEKTLKNEYLKLNPNINFFYVKSNFINKFTRSSKIINNML